jgi:hypothetical protein
MHTSPFWYAREDGNAGWLIHKYVTLQTVTMNAHTLEIAIPMGVVAQFYRTLKTMLYMTHNLHQQSIFHDTDQALMGR